MGRRLRNHIASNAIAYVALFAALSGTATASHLAVRSSDIVNGQVKNVDIGRSAVTGTKLAANSVTSGKVADGSLTGDDIASASVGGLDIADGSISGTDISDGSLWGTDINEWSLDKVPSARSADMGGTGRYASAGSCDPESTTYVTCATLGPLSLPAPGRFLVIATVSATTESDSNQMKGGCLLKVNGAIAPGTGMGFNAYDDGVHSGFHYVQESAPAIAVTNVLPAGNNYLAVECYQDTLGAIQYRSARIVAVSLSAN